MFSRGEARFCIGEACEVCAIFDAKALRALPRLQRGVDWRRSGRAESAKGVNTSDRKEVKWRIGKNCGGKC